MEDKLGIPQGGIDSPYLWNIYMLEFDNFVETELKAWFEKLNKKVRGNVVNTSKPTRIIPTPERRLTDKHRTTYKQILNFINQGA